MRTEIHVVLDMLLPKPPIDTPAAQLRAVEAEIDEVMERPCHTAEEAGQREFALAMLMTRAKSLQAMVGTDETGVCNDRE